MSLDPVFTTAWVLWLLLFAAVEGVALASRRPGRTLTAHLRAWLSLGSRTRWAGRLVMIALLAWLCFHFLTPQP